MKYVNCTGICVIPSLLPVFYHSVNFQGGCFCHHIHAACLCQVKCSIPMLEEMKYEQLNFPIPVCHVCCQLLFAVLAYHLTPS